MRRALIFVGIALVSREAAADDCGGSSGTDIAAAVLEAIVKGGSGSSSDEDTSGPAESACENDVHGYSDCKEFGERWSRKNKWSGLVEIGTAVRSFASPLGERHGTITHEQEAFSYRVAGPTSEPDTAVVGQLRVAASWRHGLYVGVEGELGALTENNAAAEMTTEGMLGTPDIRQTSAMAYGGLAIAGIGKRLGPLDLGVEGAGGVRALSYQYRSAYHACIETTSITAATPVLEARARGAVWVTPELSIGATYGRSLVDAGDTVGGLYMQWNTRTFGGH